MSGLVMRVQALTQAPAPGVAAGYAWQVVDDGRVLAAGWSLERAVAELEGEHALKGWQAVGVVA